MAGHVDNTVGNTGSKPTVTEENNVSDLENSVGLTGEKAFRGLMLQYPCKKLNEVLFVQNMLQKVVKNNRNNYDLNEINKLMLRIITMYKSKDASGHACKRPKGCTKIDCVHCLRNFIKRELSLGCFCSRSGLNNCLNKKLPSGEFAKGNQLQERAGHSKASFSPKKGLSLPSKNGLQTLANVKTKLFLDSSSSVSTVKSISRIFGEGKQCNPHSATSEVCGSKSVEQRTEIVGFKQRRFYKRDILTRGFLFKVDKTVRSFKERSARSNKLSKKFKDKGVQCIETIGKEKIPESESLSDNKLCTITETKPLSSRKSERNCNRLKMRDGPQIIFKKKILFRQNILKKAVLLDFINNSSLYLRRTNVRKEGVAVTYVTNGNEKGVSYQLNQTSDSTCASDFTSCPFYNFIIAYYTKLYWTIHFCIYVIKGLIKKIYY